MDFLLLEFTVFLSAQLLLAHQAHHSSSMSNMPSSPTRYSSHQTLHFHITSFSIHVCIFHVSFWIYGSYNYLTSGLISPPVCQFQFTSSLWITFCCSFLCPITSVFDAKHHTVYLVQYLLSIQSSKNSGEAETVLTRRQYYTFFSNIIGYLVSTGTVPCFGCAQKCFLSSNPFEWSFLQSQTRASLQTVLLSLTTLFCTNSSTWVSLDAQSAQDPISSHVSQGNKCKFSSLVSHFWEITTLRCPLGTTASHMASIT